MAELVHLGCDLLILGGGAAGCMAAVHAREADPSLEVLVVEKAHIYRSGCLAAGISALNAYLTPGETPESFLKYTQRDSVDVVRDDLTLTMAGRLNELVRRVEEELLSRGLASKGDRVVIVFGAPVGQPGKINSLRLHQISAT